MTKRQGHKLLISIVYEYVPKFSKNCHAIDHSLVSYRKNPIKNLKAYSTKVVKEKLSKQVYQQKKLEKSIVAQSKRHEEKCINNAK